MGKIKEITVEEAKKFAENELRAKGIDPNKPAIASILDLTCKMADEMDDFFGEILPKSSTDLLNSKSKSKDNEVKSKDCGWGHEWKTYHGLRESYEYCAKCDQKRPLLDE